MLLPIVFPFGILDLRFFLTTREAEMASHICPTCLPSPQFASLGTFYPILVPDSLLACLCFSRPVFVFFFFLASSFTGIPYLYLLVIGKKNICLRLK